MINPIYITKLKLHYDVELTKRIDGSQNAKHLKKLKNLKAEMNCLVLLLVIWVRLKPRIN